RSGALGPAPSVLCVAASCRHSVGRVGSGSTSAPPAPTANDSPDSRVRSSTRIAKRKKSAAAQAEVRCQKKRLVLDKEAAAAQAARETAVALGSASTAAFTPLRIRSQPASAPISAPGLLRRPYRPQQRHFRLGQHLRQQHPRLPLRLDLRHSDAHRPRNHCQPK
ncbi:hypothetical protein JG687_00012262, partial [Phytophthora cactorum]